MALNNAATFIVNAGNFYTAVYDEETPAELPEDLGVVPASPWENIGHTSLEDIMTSASEGGEATTIGTLQAKTLRTTYATRTESFGITLQQWDTKSLKLYFGANATQGDLDELRVPISPVPTVASFLAVFVDGANRFGLYIPKAEIFRAEDMSLNDTESLASLPLSIKPLVHGSNEWTYALTPLGS